MLMSKNIVIIGFRGVGKTSVSRALSQKLGWPLIDVDAEIRKKIGSVFESVKAFGWTQFHQVESEIIAGIDATKTVIDCGGGAVLRAENIAHLKSNGVIVFLTAQSQTIVKRLQKSHDRPSISNNKTTLEEVEETLKQRLPLYQQAADMEIDTDDKTLEEIVTEIILKMGYC